jgi:hypothetical protein
MSVALIQVGSSPLGASTGFLGAFDLFGVCAAFAVDSPSAAVGDHTDLLDVQVHHVAWPARVDAARLAVVAAVRVEHAAVVQAQVGQLSGDGAHRDHHAFVAQLESDATGGVLAVAAQLLDPDDGRGRGDSGLPSRGTRAVGQTDLAVAAVAVDPLRGALTGDTPLGGDMSDRTVLAALNETAAPFDGQRGITVKHGRVFLLSGRVGGTSHPAAERPVPRLRPYQLSPTS